ncbi:glycosyltransferase family 2 protein [Olivibacter sp. CPCC 100613]|uniref:glycosyltransferase family 2 protein n=1 Tax=Olivibacter sp. CPCC 100613 TaxID=3079931 RepID=UPI002FF80A79
MKNMRVSIIIPIYNAEKTLEKCFNSCLNQKWDDLEIIAINDCSSDGSAAICNHYANENFQFHVIHNRMNLGPQQSRPLGIKKATGDFLFFLDADDYIPSQSAINILCQQQIKTNGDVIIGGYEIIDDIQINRVIPPMIDTTDPVDKLVFFFTHSFRTLWAKLYRKNLFNGLAVPDNIYHGEDLILNTQIFAQSSFRVTSVDTVIYGYKRTASSITSNLSFDNALNVLKAEHWMYNYLYNQGLLTHNLVYNQLCLHAISKIIAAIKQRRGSKFDKNYFDFLYRIFYKPCPIKLRKQFPIHNRILIPLENFSPWLSTLYIKLLDKVTS